MTCRHSHEELVLEQGLITSFYPLTNSEETKSLSTKCPELMKLQRATRETERKT